MKAFLDIHCLCRTCFTLVSQLLAILYGVVALSKKLADDAPICQDFNAKQTGAWKFLEKDTNMYVLSLELPAYV